MTRTGWLVNMWHFNDFMWQPIWWRLVINQWLTSWSDWTETFFKEILWFLNSKYRIWSNKICPLKKDHFRIFEKSWLGWNWIQKVSAEFCWHGPQRTGTQTDMNPSGHGRGQVQVGPIKYFESKYNDDELWFSYRSEYNLLENLSEHMLVFLSLKKPADLLPLKKLEIFQRHSFY